MSPSTMLSMLVKLIAGRRFRRMSPEDQELYIKTYGVFLKVVGVLLLVFMLRSFFVTLANSALFGAVVIVGLWLLFRRRR